MIEQLSPDLYRIEIPLPRNPLKSLNSYLIKSDERFLLIDTGMNREECREAIWSALETLNVDRGKMDFFITHLHADHLGLVANLATDTSKVYFNEQEAVFMNKLNSDKGEEYWGYMNNVYLANGFPEKELKISTESHPGRRTGLNKIINFCVLKEGDKIGIGDYAFTCIETPGHSPGHMCLYEPGKKLLFAGDHILFDITPNITYWHADNWFDMKDSLQKYLSSLEKVYGLDVNLVLPGHRSLMNNHKKRINELLAHHEARANEVVAAINKGARNTFQIAPHVTWDIDAKSWAEFPSQQKWFAFGETLAHLRYLEGKGRVRSENIGGKVIYSLV